VRQSGSPPCAEPTRCRTPAAPDHSSPVPSRLTKHLVPTSRPVATWIA
jgi:hypothetical protein